MGFYDCNCMLTGISLMGIRATTVVLQRSGDTYAPITLGITGTYDRLGKVDGIREDLNTELVLRYFMDRSLDGRFFADDQTSVHDGGLSSDSDIEDLLHFVERTDASIALGIDESPSAALDGGALFSALIAQPVWDAVTAGPATSDSSSDQRFRRVFGDTSAPNEIYRERLLELTTPLNQLAAVDDFVKVHGLRWAPVPEPSQRYATDGYGGQHYLEDIQEFLDRAKHDYRDEPVVLTGLADYERLIDRE